MMTKPTVITTGYMPMISDSGHGFRSRYLPLFENEGGGGSIADDAAVAAAAAVKVAEETAAAKKTSNADLSESEAKLLKEVMKNKKLREEAEGRLKAFEGIDPTAVRELIAANERAKVDAAERERVAAEEKAKASGDYEALKSRMAKEHETAMKAERDRVAEEAKKTDKLAKQVHELTIGAGFANSKYIAENLVMPATKARRIYETHFAVENGKVVAYDAPEGTEGREPLVDARGNSLSFDDAIAKIVEADPDRDRLLKGKTKQGSGNTPAAGAAGRQNTEVKLTGAARMAAIMKSNSK